jgi:nucleotide-binding universal stress UspA family protein
MEPLDGGVLGREHAMSDPVIVGVDGSASSLDAVELAAREARLRGVPLRIVHAFGRPAAHLPSAVAPANPADHRLEPMVRRVLACAEGRAHAAAPGIEVTRSVVPGEVLAMLEIESRSAAVAVVGSRGLSGFAGLLLGSTAVHLAAHGHCPLMVVRGRPVPAGPVLLAVDGSEEGETAVEFAFAEAAVRKAPLVALHIWNTWSERAFEGPGDPLTAAASFLPPGRPGIGATRHMRQPRWPRWRRAGAAASFPPISTRSRSSPSAEGGRATSPGMKVSC